MLSVHAFLVFPLGFPCPENYRRLFLPQMLPKLLALLWAAIPIALSQSNYASQGNSIEYQPGLPPNTVLDGKVTNLDDISSTIFLNRTKAYLNCGQGSMEVELEFKEPFHGVAYADFDRNSACIFKGRGATTAKLELPLKGTSLYRIQLKFALFSKLLAAKSHVKQTSIHTQSNNESTATENRKSGCSFGY